MTAPDPRDVDLVDRAVRPGDELGRARLRTTVAALVSIAAALLVALVVVAMQKGARPLVPNPDDRPAFSEQVRFTPPLLDPDTVRALLVHGRSARVAS